MEPSLTSYRVSEPEMSGGRSQAGEEIIQERRTEVITVPAPPEVHAPPPPEVTEVVQETKIVDVHRSPSPAYSHRSHGHHHHGSGPIVVDAGPRDESTFIERRREVYERSDPIPVGPLALALPAHRPRHDERAIRAEIKALEAEKEALKAQKRADREIRRAERYRGDARVSQRRTGCLRSRTIRYYRQ